MSKPSPEQVTRLRVATRTKLEFLSEVNVFSEGDTVTRSELRRGLQRLTGDERRALEARIRSRQRRVTELMYGNRKSFDAPRATGVNLTDEVVIEDPKA